MQIKYNNILSDFQVIRGGLVPTNYALISPKQAVQHYTHDILQTLFTENNHSQYHTFKFTRSDEQRRRVYSALRTLLSVDKDSDVFPVLAPLQHTSPENTSLSHPEAPSPR